MRIIDADAIKFESNEFDTYNDYSIAFDAIDKAPTIDLWHYSSKGEVPDKDGEYFILREYRGKLFADTANYSVKRGWLGIITFPHAWQYIIPPKEEA